jgi:surfactin synthase thioesterase subunit
VPSAQLRVIDGGHLLLLEQPAEAGRAIRELLDDQDRADDASDSACLDVPT